MDIPSLEEPRILKQLSHERPQKVQINYLSHPVR